MNLKVRTLNPPVKTNPAEAAIARVRAICEDQKTREKWANRPVRPEKKPGAKKKVSVDSNSADWIRAQGMHCAKVETWDGIRKEKHDLLGIYDQLALGKGETWGVQTTTKANMSARRAKILGSKGFEWAKAAGWKTVILGWFKNGSGRWECAIEWL